jgi:hypothetical protein
MAITLLVSEQYMRDNLPISRNLDTKDITPNIQASQELYLQDILGQNFYQYIMNTFSAQTLNANEVILVQDYIKPAVAYRALEMALPFLQYNIKNKGAMRQTTEFGDSADFTQMRFLLNEVSNRAQFYEKRLVKYLSANDNLFPQFITNNDDIIKPNPRNGWDNGGLLFY